MDVLRDELDDLERRVAALLHDVPGALALED